MNIQIITKNYKASEKLQSNIEKKFEKLGKYFNDDASATIVLSRFRDASKIEATIQAKKNIFRAEEVSDNIYEAMDIAIAKLSNQMSKFKGKLEISTDSHAELQDQGIRLISLQALFPTL